MNSPVMLSGGGLWVEFVWTGDRWGHRVGIEPDRAPIIESIEGTADNDWPPSPALQELHLEERADGKRVALLVGMAGTSHWSMSVELDADLGQAVFDVAGRVKSQSAVLGSTYADSANWGVRLGLNASAADGHVLEKRNDSGQFRIHPQFLVTKSPQTIRWRYVFDRLTSDSPP